VLFSPPLPLPLLNQNFPYHLDPAYPATVHPRSQFPSCLVRDAIAGSTNTYATLRARHLLVMRIAVVAGSYFEVLESIAELERTKREVGTGAVVWVIGGWKVGWASSTSARLPWCVGKRSTEQHRTIG
jgi:hypothetical protein